MASCRVTGQVTCIEGDPWQITEPAVVLRQGAQLGICASPGSADRLEGVHEFGWEKGLN